MSSTSENQVVEDTAPPPPALKKRATKRGLSKALPPSSDQPDAQSDAHSQSHLTSVYSSCVQRSSALSFSMLDRRPLFSKQNNEAAKSVTLSELPEPRRQRPSRAASTVASIIPQAPVSSIVIEDDLDEDEIENSMVSADEVSIIRSPSPPVPPPPPPPVRTKAQRISKGIRNAFKTLDSMKGELRMGVMTSPSPVMTADSPVMQRDSMVVRVRHIDDIHRFTMTKRDMYYALQSQMAGLLDVDADQIGLYLNDCRLAPSDTPQSTHLRLADIIVCHVLVEEAGASGDAGVSDSDSIRVQMQCPNSRQNTHMVVQKHLPLKTMMEKYAQMRGRPVEKFQFHFDGELLSPTMLPGHVELEEDDTIDVVEKK